MPEYHKNYISAVPKSETLTPYSFMVLDIETEGLGGPFIACDIYDGHTHMFLHSLSDVWDALLSLPSNTDIWAHNGAKFDYLYLLDSSLLDEHILPLGYRIRVIQSGTQALGLIVSKGKWSIRLKDFYRFTSSSLSKVSKDFRTPHQKLIENIDFEAGETWSWDNPDHVQYLQNDVMVLYEAITTFRETWFDLFGICKLPFSLPSLAYTSWRATIPTDKDYSKSRRGKTVSQRIYRHKPELRDFFRRGYFGGLSVPKFSYAGNRRTNLVSMPLRRVTKGEAFQGESYDFNSMYPSVMLEGVPLGNPTYVTTFDESKPGFYECEVAVPKDHPYPFLYSHEHKLGTGVFRSTLSSEEIRFARTQGIGIAVIQGRVFDKLYHIFDDFVNTCKTIRYSETGTVKEKIAKLAQNSLYGKFGTKELGQTIEIYADEPREDEEHLRIDMVTGLPNRNLHVTEQVIDEPYLMPHIAAWITASARVKLARIAIAAAEENRLLYTDTDSLKLVMNGDSVHMRSLLPIDQKAYGSLKLEYTFDEFVALGPKTYGIHCTECEPEKEWITHSKGTPTKDLRFDDLVDTLDGKTVSVPVTYLSSMMVQLSHGTGVMSHTIHRAVTSPANLVHFRLIDGQFIPEHLTKELA